MMWPVFIAIVFVVALGYIWAIAKAAHAEVVKSPREKMFMCDIHGPVSVKHTFKLGDDFELDYDDGHSEKGPLLVCPFCFEDKMKQASQKVGR